MLQRTLARDFVFAVRTYDQKTAALKLVAQELEQRQRRRIGPVQVIDDRDEWHLLRRLCKEAGDGVEHPKSRLGGIERGSARRGRTIPVRKLGYDRGDVAYTLPHREPNLARRRRIDKLAQDLHPRPVRRSAGFLVTTAPNNERPLVFCGVCKRFGAAAFADSGLATEHEDLAAPAKHLVERAFEETELFCAPHEGRVDAAGGPHGILQHGPGILPAWSTAALINK